MYRSRQYTYGFDRAEGLLGGAIVLAITFRAAFAMHQTVERLLKPGDRNYVQAVAGADLVGFTGNGAATLFRIRVGKKAPRGSIVPR
jgi:divalent metal cation (Fe/Co/Zn/Cd) transporter